MLTLPKSAEAQLIDEFWDVSFESRSLDTSRIGDDGFDIWARWTYKVTVIQDPDDNFSHIAFGLPDDAFDSDSVLNSVLILDASGDDVTSDYSDIKFRDGGGPVKVNGKTLEINNQVDLLTNPGDYNIIFLCSVHRLRKLGLLTWE